MKTQPTVVGTLLVALDAIRSIPPKNLKDGPDFGEPFKVNPKGQCTSAANLGGWLAQHPHFKEQGVAFENVPLAGGLSRFMPVLKIDGPVPSTLRGWNALSRVMGLDGATTHKVLSSAEYGKGEFTPENVVKRLRAAISKVPGGKDALKAHEKAINAHLKAAEKAVKAKAKAAEKAVKDAKKAEEKAKKAAEKAKKKAEKAGPKRRGKVKKAKKATKR